MFSVGFGIHSLWKKKKDKICCSTYIAYLNHSALGDFDIAGKTVFLEDSSISMQAKIGGLLSIKKIELWNNYEKHLAIILAVANQVLS